MPVAGLRGSAPPASASSVGRTGAMARPTTKAATHAADGLRASSIRAVANAMANAANRSRVSGAMAEARRADAARPTIRPNGTP